MNVADLGILATNYGASSGMTLIAGDFNGDGAVNVADLGVLATGYGQSLAAGMAAAPFASMAMAITAKPGPTAVLATRTVAGIAAPTFAASNRVIELIDEPFDDAVVGTREPLPLPR